MELRVYNTISGKKETFAPIEEGKVKMYACGVTVYDHCHIGHARSVIVFDVIYRYLLHLGYDVNFVRNFTDIDDKTIRDSQAAGISLDEHTRKFKEMFFRDLDTGKAILIYANGHLEAGETLLRLRQLGEGVQ